MSTHLGRHKHDNRETVRQKNHRKLSKGQNYLKEIQAVLQLRKQI